MNKTRTKTTHEYIRECHSVYLVSPIARVQTDNLVHHRLLEFSKTFGTKKALICTKIDVCFHRTSILAELTK